MAGFFQLMYGLVGLVRVIKGAYRYVFVSAPGSYEWDAINNLLLLLFVKKSTFAKTLSSTPPFCVRQSVSLTSSTRPTRVAEVYNTSGASLLCSSLGGYPVTIVSTVSSMHT